MKITSSNSHTTRKTTFGTSKKSKHKRHHFNPFAIDYANWMSQLPAATKNRSITELTLPATHNSGAYQVDFTHPLKDDIQAKTTCMVARISPYVHKLISDWTITQQGTIYEQLMQGVRVFDIRLSYSDSELYVSHTFACVKFSDVLEQFKQFSIEHPHEVIVIAIKPDWAHKDTMTSEGVNQAFILLKQALGQKMAPAQSDFKAVSVSSLNKEGKQFIVFFDGQGLSGDASNYLWASYLKQTHWTDSATIEELQQKLPQYMPTTSSYTFSYLPCYLTPDQNTIVGASIKGAILPFIRFDTLQTHAKKIATYTRAFMNNPGYFYNVVECDFILDSSTITEVVTANFYDLGASEDSNEPPA